VPTHKTLSIASLAAVAALNYYDANARTLTTLCSFAGGADGTTPSQLVYRNGLLYGTTYSGGEGCGGIGCGTVFTVDPATGTKTIIHMFHGHAKGVRSGEYPSSGLSGVSYDDNGLFGTTYSGGARGAACSGGCGTVFRINAVSGAQTIIYSFPGGTAGAVPAGGLTLDDGALFGTTQVGGKANQGILFKLELRNLAEHRLYTFRGAPGPGLPDGGMILVNQQLVGTSVEGGNAYYGTVFEFDPATGVETTLHSFQGHKRDGALPVAGLAASGRYIYGATSVGGRSGFGILFRIKVATGAERVLYSFRNGDDGGTPTGGVIYQDGYLYGTASHGASGYGTIYRFNCTKRKPNVLYKFQNGTDGGAPTSLIYRDGVFYGTTSSGGDGYGTVFKFVP
jgi:uncharacterized repeat protein (TIGR03803 family)